MSAYLSIIEILERSEQGVTRPFLCRCDDGNLYYAKGRAAGARSLICEWLAGNLAQAFGLPVPPFSVAIAPPGLLALHPEGQALGELPLFVSRQVAYADALGVAHLQDVDVRLQREILAFDWWVNNADRTLTVHSGNPNLLWDGSNKALVVIDHNLAFDKSFDTAAFRQTHVFAGQFHKIDNDFFEPDRLREKMKQALDVWVQTCKNVPQQWWFADAEQTVPADFDLDAAFALLNRYADKDFWRMTP